MKSRTKRQAFRKLLLLISFLLFPLSLYYFSPYLIVEALARGILAGSFFLFTAQLTGAIFFGRLFCGWLCPAGGLQEMCGLVNNKLHKGKWRKLGKYVIWTPWMTVMALLIIRAGGIKKLDFFYQTQNGISVADPSGYIIYYGVLFLIVILAVIGGRRSFCHSACWMAPFMQIGISLRKLLRLPGLKLAAEPQKCIGCSQCSKKCSMSLPVMELVKKGSIAHPDCSLCGECVDVCPAKVIRYAIGK